MQGAPVWHLHRRTTKERAAQDRSDLRACCEPLGSLVLYTVPVHTRRIVQAGYMRDACTGVELIYQHGLPSRSTNVYYNVVLDPRGRGTCVNGTSRYNSVSDVKREQII